MRGRNSYSICEERFIPSNVPLTFPKSSPSSTTGPATPPSAEGSSPHAASSRLNGSHYTSDPLITGSCEKRQSTSHPVSLSWIGYGTKAWGAAVRRERGLKKESTWRGVVEGAD